MNKKSFLLITIITVSLLFIIASAIFLFGITISWGLHGDSTVLLQINTPEPKQYKVGIVDEKQNRQQLDNRGRIILRVPGRCVEARYIFGYRCYGRDLYEDPSIEIIKNEVVIKRFSLRDIDSLKIGNDGYHELDL